MTQFEAVLDYFKKMDFEMLDMILIDEINYQNTSKKIFLEKLNIIFNDIKKSGNTEIELAAGRCNCPSCQTGFKIGYSFIGNNNRKHLELMFDLSPDYIVYDIYNCNKYTMEKDIWTPYDFVYKNKSIPLNARYSIRIYDDELYNFRPDEYYNYLSENLKNAYMEVEDGNEKHIDLLKISNWLTKHEKLNKTSVIRNYKCGQDFLLLYMHFEHIQSYYFLISSAENAVKEYSQKLKITKDELIKWLIKHQALGCAELVMFGDNFIEEDNNSEKWFLPNFYSIFFLKEDFKSIIKFKKIFDSYYWDILEEEVKYFELNNSIKLDMDNHNLNYFFNNSNYK